MSAEKLGPLLSQISKYGLSTVLVVWGCWGLLIPMRDGHLEFLNAVSESNQQAVEAIKSISESTTTQTGILENISETQETIVEQQRVIIDRTQSRWTAEDMKAWAAEMKKANPDIEVVNPNPEYKAMP